MMKVYEIIDVIEKTAPPGIAASWDASGVQVAALRQEISRVAVMLDPSLVNLRRAVDAGADFILAHHPLSMKPRFPNVCDDYLAILSLLFTKNVWLYSAHTSLDANPRGPVLWLAHVLGLEDLRVLEPVPGAHAPFAQTSPAALNPGDREDLESGPTIPEGFGFGFTGVLPKPVPYADFRAKLAESLGKKDWQRCGPKPECVSRVACCPGAGGSILQEALRCGADVFITGDVKYHTALDAIAGGLRVLDVGHFILEEEMMRRFAEQIANELPVAVSFFSGHDPFAGEYC